MRKFTVFMVLLVCVISFVGCGQKTDKDSDTDVKPTVLTVEERKDVFVSYFNHSDKYNATEIKENLDKIGSTQVLTLDEALSVFWVENELNPKDYLQKTSENGQVYYQHKVDKNEIKVFVSLLYPDTENGTENVNNIMDYGFYIIQTDGQDYFIGVNGEILPID